MFLLLSDGFELRLAGRLMRRTANDGALACRTPARWGYNIESLDNPPSQVFCERCILRCKIPAISDASLLFTLVLGCFPIAVRSTLRRTEVHWTTLPSLGLQGTVQSVHEASGSTPARACSREPLALPRLVPSCLLSDAFLVRTLLPLLSTCRYLYGQITWPSVAVSHFTTLVNIPRSCI